MEDLVHDHQCDFALGRAALVIAAISSCLIAIDLADQFVEVPAPQEIGALTRAVVLAAGATVKPTASPIFRDPSLPPAPVATDAPPQMALLEEQ